jgi:dephospho-CoA kinase
MTYLLGLTGSIGMGKSTTARLFKEAGCDVWDADEAVHRLYAKGGAAVAPLHSMFSGVIEQGAVSRDRLKAIIAERPEALNDVEAIVHPLVAKDRACFLDETTSDIAVFDIPLLYETGADGWLHAVVCVTVAPDIQRARVLQRGSMTGAQFETILAKQLPDAEKRARADYVIETDTLDHARQQVQAVITDIQQGIG